MKKNIDLTLNGDFQKRRPPRNILKHSNSQVSPLSNFRSNEDDLKTSEIETNFATGSISSIKNKEWKMKLYRNLDLIEASCDRCGGYLYIKQETLCERCDRAMEEELHNEYLYELLSR